MKRLKKVILLPLRNLAYRRKHLRLYYWADNKLYALQDVSVMPDYYYRWLYQVSMTLVESDRFRQLADRAIHTIPYHIRFDVA